MYHSVSAQLKVVVLVSCTVCKQLLLLFKTSFKTRPVYSFNMTTQDTIEVAKYSFKDAESYDKARSGYKAKIVHTFLDKLGVFDCKTTPVTILELGAGSGQFTKAISEATKDCKLRQIASEPLETMSHVLRQNNPGVEYINCRAEKIPLPDNSVNAVVAANAVHYFSNAKSYAEICRVLIPGGMVGFCIKSPNPQPIPWVLEILKDASVHYKNAGVDSVFDENGEDFNEWGPALQKSGLFEDVQNTNIDETDPMNEDEAIEYFMSYGAFFACGSSEREKIRLKVEKLVRSNYSEAGKVLSEIPFKSFLYWAKKK